MKDPKKWLNSLPDDNILTSKLKALADDNANETQ